MPAKTDPVVLTPIRATVIAYLVGGILFVALAVFFVVGVLSLDYSGVPAGPAASLPVTLPIAVPICALGVLLATRGTSMKVVLKDDGAEVRNVFRTRFIPRKQVLGLGFRTTVYARPYPGIRWHDPKRGKDRTTVINFLSPAGVRSPLETRVNAMTEQLSTWCKARR